MASVGQPLSINLGRHHCKLREGLPGKGDAHGILTRSVCGQGTAIISFDPFPLGWARSVLQTCFKATVITHSRSRLIMSSEKLKENPQPYPVREQ